MISVSLRFYSEICRLCENRSKREASVSRLRCFFMQRPRSFVAFCRFLEYNHLCSGCRSDQNPAKTVGSEEDNMMIINIENKRDYISLLLLADEQENMIDRYLDRGTMYVLEDGGIVKGECDVTDEGGRQLIDKVYLWRRL